MYLQDSNVFKKYFSRLKSIYLTIIYIFYLTIIYIAYNKQLHKFLIYMVKETSIKTTHGR